jgi:hypothetical protein
MGESQHPDPGSGKNNPDHIFLELRNHFFAFFGVKILKFFDEDPGSGMETVRIRDPGWKKVGSGIRDKHPGSATLTKTPVKTTFSDWCLYSSFVHVSEPLINGTWSCQACVEHRQG